MEQLHTTISNKFYNILIETSFLHTNFTPLSNKKLLEYNLNLKNGAGGLGTIPETMKITVMKPIKKGNHCFVNMA